MLKIVYSFINAANLHNDYRPLPPTPMSKALPRVYLKTRDILDR